MDIHNTISLCSLSHAEFGLGGTFQSLQCHPCSGKDTFHHPRVLSPVQPGLGQGSRGSQGLSGPAVPGPGPGGRGAPALGSSGASSGPAAAAPYAADPDPAPVGAGAGAALQGGSPERGRRAPGPCPQGCSSIPWSPARACAGECPNAGPEPSPWPC